MEKFFEAAAIAWNPIGEVRRRMASGSLSVKSVLVPFIGIVITCNLFAYGAQKFFWESVLSALGGQLPNLPLMNSDYAQRLLSALGVLVPVAAAALLPERTFHPAGRSATVAAMLVVAAAWAFYGAAIGVPVHFFAGVLAAVNVELVLKAYMLLSILMIIAILGLMVFFWFRIMVSVLKLSAPHVTGLSVVVLAAEVLLAGFFLLVVSASHPTPD